MVVRVLALLLSLVLLGTGAKAAEPVPAGSVAAALVDAPDAEVTLPELPALVVVPRRTVIGWADPAPARSRLHVGSVFRPPCAVRSR